jgi:glycosyltransferase involved in cell wall biosynthesis
VVILQGTTLRLGWPLLLRRKCAVMVHHMAPGSCENQATAWLRERLALRARHAAVSEALARTVRWRVEAILPDPYDETVLRGDSTVARDLDVAFVGRLILEKGAHVLVEALSILKGRGTRLTASIVGDGPELKRLKQSIDAGQLREDVKLKGRVSGVALARLLNQHRVLVAPSLCAEGFGLAALEGIACGCVVLGSRLGGLPEAIGCCGMTFPAGDAEGLAEMLAEVLRSPERLDRFRIGAEQHLAKHRPATVARRYLEFVTAGELRLVPKSLCAMQSAI